MQHLIQFPYGEQGAVHFALLCPVVRCWKVRYQVLGKVGPFPVLRVVLAFDAVEYPLYDDIGVIGHHIVLEAHCPDASVAGLSQELVHVPQGLVWLGVLEVS